MALVVALLSAHPALAGEVAGAEVFAAHCAVCHGPKGEGVAAVFPPLGTQIKSFAQSPAGREYLVTAVSAGLIGSVSVAGGTYQGAMPAQALSEAEAAAVLNFLVVGMGKGKAASPAFVATEVSAIRSRHPGISAVAALALRPASSEK